MYVYTIESVHNRFCKNILYVHRTTDTCIVLGECGRLPQCTIYYINCIRYWCKLLTMPSHSFPKQCYNVLKSLDDAGRNCWATKIIALLYKNGFSFILISQDVGDVNHFIRMFKHRGVNYYTLDWQNL